MIFNIQRYSIHDGEGIRTTVFFKGCPLKCQWCSNPESQSFGHSIMYDRRACKDLGDCFHSGGHAISKQNGNGIEIHRQLIKDPLKLKDICPTMAITISGESKTVDEILIEVEKDIPFYRNNGGVTFSGGEALAQGEILTLLLGQLHERSINVSIETSLHVKWAQVERCIGLVDTFLVDLKHTNLAKFETYIQGDGQLVMDNMIRLSHSGAYVVVRIPVIPGFNHTEKEMKEMIDFASSITGIKEIHFLPYHTLGVEKYEMLGMDYLFGQRARVQEAEIEPYMLYAQSQGFKTKIGG
jgi:pyruvate formate lyase activating enzyme